MGSFPRSPALTKGALVVFDPANPSALPQGIIFQYNPEELSRSLSERTFPTDEVAAREESPTRSGALIEQISLKVEIDATDQLEVRDPTTLTLGIHPVLSSLEMLVLPSLLQIQAQKALSSMGTAFVNPPQMPLVLFVWGTTRVLPVRVVSLSIKETAFDARLNPIHAQVSLVLRTLTHEQLTETSVGYQVYLAMQARREVMARLNMTSAASRLQGT